MLIVVIAILCIRCNRYFKLSDNQAYQPTHLNKILQSPSGNIKISTKRHSKKELREEDCSFVTENNDINLGFETFLRFINRTLNKHAPIKTVKKKKAK